MMSGRHLKLVAVLAAALLLAIAHFAGLLEPLREPERAAQTLVDLGVWGYLAFVVSFALLQPFGIPGTVFVVAAALIWPWPIAFALSMIGTMAASVLGFSFARFVARDWVAKRIPPRFRKYDEALATRALTTVFVLRLVFWMAPPLHASLGVSQVRFWTHFWGSFAGYLLPLLLLSVYGQQLFDFAKDAPPAAWIAFGAVVLLFALVGWMRRSAVRRSGVHPLG